MSVQEAKHILIPIDRPLPGEPMSSLLYPLIHTGPVDCTLLHVVPPEGQAPEVAARLTLEREHLQDQEVPVQVRIVSGRPSEQILRFASSGCFDLVAMATHGRRGLDRVMMGSIAEEVVRNSAVPTLLCRSGIRPRGWERIVVALDGLPGAEEVLDEVRSLALRMGSAVHLLQVGLNLLRTNSYRGVAFEVPEEHSTYLETVAARLMGQGLTVTTDRRLGMAGAEIAMFAKEIEAGLICMTTHGHPEELPGLDRSVAAEVMQQAPCPVYVRRMTGAACRVG